MRKQLYKAIRIGVVLTTLIFLNTCRLLEPTEEVYRRDELLMGTVVDIQVVHSNPTKATNLLDKAFKYMKELVYMMDVHREDSEISRVNREAYIHPVEVSPELYEIISLSLQISRLTNGAFDITVGPLLKIWPIYKKSGFSLPDATQLQNALARVGWQNLYIDETHRTVHFAKENMSLDLGGIAKGYIVDKTAEFLKNQGISGALIDAGGDIYALGTAPKNKPWHIGIQHPRDGRELIAILELKDIGVVTSGDYERYVIKDGVRYTHIIDPRTGFTVRKTASVTLIGKSTAFIDAIATAIMVEGVEKGMTLVQSIPHINALIITEDQSGKLVFSYTPELLDYVNWGEFSTNRSSL